MKLELIKYAIAGGLAFSCDFTVLYLCTEHLGWHYLVSNIASYSAGLLVSYWLNVTWVFSQRRFAARSWLEFTLFNLIVLLGFALSEALMALLVEVAGLHYLTSKVVSAAAVVVYNYGAKKYLLFSEAPLLKRG